MSGPDLAALLREAYDASNREGVSAFGRVLAPRVEVQERPKDVRPRRLDRDQVLERLEALGWHNWRVEPEDMRVFDDGVVVTLREVMAEPAERPSGRPRVHYWRFGPGGAERLEVYRNPVAALKAATGYFALLDRLHGRLRPRTYAEIGVHIGRSLGRVHPDTVSIGIDPEPNLHDATVEEASRIFRVTSDDFFRDHDLRAELGGLSLDLAFIDGMHLFEYALRDFMNLERYCTPQSVILVHDCYPRARVHAQRDRETVEWCGDVWKIIPCLREQRPDLNIAAIDIEPAGMGIITGLDPSSTVLRDRYNEIEAQYIGLDYGWVEEDQPERLARIDHDWDQIERLLPPPFRGPPEPAGEPVG